MVKSIIYCRIGEVGLALPFIFLCPPENYILEGPEPGYGLCLLGWAELECVRGRGQLTLSQEPTVGGKLCGLDFLVA